MFGFPTVKTGLREKWRAADFSLKRGPPAWLTFHTHFAVLILRKGRAAREKGMQTDWYRGDKPARMANYQNGSAIAWMEEEWMPGSFWDSQPSRWAKTRFDDLCLAVCESNKNVQMRVRRGSEVCHGICELKHRMVSGSEYMQNCPLMESSSFLVTVVPAQVPSVPK